MNEAIRDLYKISNTDNYQDVHLLTLSEQCALLEEQVYALAKDLPAKKRHIIEDYISMRNDLEYETVKTALRWGKRHYK